MGLVLSVIGMMGWRRSRRRRRSDSRNRSSNSRNRNSWGVFM